MRKLFLQVIPFLIALCLLTACNTSENLNEIESVMKYHDIDTAKAALLIVRLEDGQIWSYGGERIDTRFVAASTSKIPHTFIALENGYVEGPETIFKWDGQERWSAGWNQDQTMAKAYARSAMWVYQNISQSLGPEKMAVGIQMFEYGNQDIGGPEDITTYWLTGPLKISAREQVQFLTKLHNEHFPLSQKTYAVGKEIMRAGRTDARSAKTGWYYSEEEPDIGWYVGWQTVTGLRGMETYIFAFNMDMNDRKIDPPKRIPLVDAVLEKISTKTRSQ